MTRSLRLTGVGLVLLLAGVLAASWWLQRPVPEIDDQARSYVRLVLELGRRAPGEVDFYFGPVELQPIATSAVLTSAQLKSDISSLRSAVEAAQSRQPLVRRQRLLGKLIHLQRLVALLDEQQGQSFEEQARRVYGIRADLIRTDTTSVLAQLDQLLPGPGALFERLQTWRNQWLIAPEQRQRVFERALQECRRRTQMHWKLGAEESLEIRWTRRTPAAWHRYLGNSHSVLQVSPDAAAYFPSILTLACHEAYPGHHAQYLLMDAAAGSAGMPVEDTVVLLRSRQSVLLEGAANLGAALVFGDEERLAFERDVLLPLAGLPVELASKQRQISQLEAQLAPNVLPILRDFYDNTLSRDEAIRQLQDLALLPEAPALLDYARQWGAYVMGYTAVERPLQTALQTAAAEHGTDIWRQLQVTAEHPADVHIASLTVDPVE